jgi:hypothetical protein
MNSEYFFAQDQAGSLQRVKVSRHAPGHDKDQAHAKTGPVYALEDGRPLRRIDNDTFQVLETGALVTLLRD